MAASLRIALVGAGSISKAHIAPLLSDPDVEIVAIADPVADRCSERAADVRRHRPGATVEEFADAARMLRSVHPDAAFILVPPFGHGAAEKACVEAGIPFFVEKPVGLDAAMAREIAAQVEAVGLLTCAGYMNRYRKGVQAARALLQSDAPILMHGGWVGGSPGTQPGSWWVQKSLSGGQIVEQTTHTFDLVRYLGGEAVETYAHGATGFNHGIPGYSLEDASVVNIRLASGGVACLMSCCAANGGGGGVWLTVYSHAATMCFSGWEHSLRMLKRGAEPDEIKGEDDIFAIEDGVFLEAVRTGDGRGILSTYADAIRTLELTLAANRSLETGTPVSVAGA